MGLSAAHSNRPVRIIEAPVRISVWAVLGAWLVRRLFRLMVWLVRTPAALIIVVVVVAGVYGWRQVHPAVVLGPAGLVMAVLGLWLAQWPASFDRLVWHRVRSGWRAGLIYRWRWSAAMDTARLTITRNGTEFVPPLLKVRSTATVDRVLLRMLAGQTVEDYAAAADRLAQTFGAVAGRVRSVPGKPHLVELWLLVRDPLVQLVEPFDPDPDVLTAGIPVARGRTERSGGSSWSAPMSWSSGRPGPGKAR